MKKTIIVTMLYLGASGELYAAPGDLDTSFGTSGYVQQDFGTNDCVEDACIDPASGRITTVGYMPLRGTNVFFVAQFAPNGSLVTSFGLAAGFTMDAFMGYGAAANSLDISKTNHAAARRIVVAGYAKNVWGASLAAVNRYLPTGRPDRTFLGGGGIISALPSPGLAISYRSTRAEVVKIDDNSKILLGGTYNAYSATYPYVTRGFLMRLNWNGSLDTSFGGGVGYITQNLGGISDGVYDIALDGTNKIYALSYYSDSGIDWAAVTAYDYNGSIDTNFGASGTAIIDFATWLYPEAMEIDANTNLVVAGIVDTSPCFKYFLARLNSTGTYDSGFAGVGYTTGTFLTATSDSGAGDLKIDTDGNILVGGGTAASSSDLMTTVARFLDDGTLDTTFGTNGIINTSFTNNIDLVAICLDQTNNILSVNQYDNGTDDDIEIIKLSH